MRVDFKDFNKLKQLDKIEYLLKTDNIRKQYSYTFGISIIYCIFNISFIILMLLGFYSAFQTIPIKIIKMLPLQYLFIYFIFMLDFIMAIYYSFKRNKYLKEIYDEFFEVKAK